jgi:hypothetical protein
MDQPGGDFLITPDSNAIAITQGEGLAILPLQESAKTIDFLPKFGMVLGFARDGSAAATVKFNSDYTRSLFIVTNQEMEKEILRTQGSIRSAIFDPSRETLYCLLTELLPGQEYREEPFIAAIDLNKVLKSQPATADEILRPLVRLPNQQDVHISLAPDGLALLFDQTVPADPNASNADPRNPQAESRVWLLPIAPEPTTVLAPKSLPFPALHPRWLP